MVDGLPLINGNPVHQDKETPFSDDGYKKGKSIQQYRETLPNGVSYMVLDEYLNTPSDNMSAVTVPAGHYYVLGDNRDSSLDSRNADKIGFVQADHIFAKAAYVVWNMQKNLGAVPDN